MISACRGSLRGLTPSEDAHARLLIDRYLRAHKEMDGAWSGKGPTPEQMTLDFATKCSACEPYKMAFERWRTLCRDKRYLVVEAATAGPLAVGLGAESPLEVGLTVHRTYGMPVIPGSAVKGVCRRAALDANLDEQSEAFRALFGDQTKASCFVFWDAWYDPSTVNGKPFHRDVLTVHHPEYYGSKGEEGWPTDFDDPTPVPFLVVRPGAGFVFAVKCPDPKWEGYVRAMLTWTLTNAGIGGKTNAGYGRFSVTPYVPPPPEPVDEVWKGVQVKRSASPLAFIVEAAPKPAKADGRAADQINTSLPKEFRERLKKRPTFTADVVVTVQGDRVTILEIRPVEEG